jgi:signal transduction histidine kinase
VLHSFLIIHREDLLARCRQKVGQRPNRAPSPVQLANGIPLFLDQLTRTLQAEHAEETAESLRISGPSGGEASTLSEIGVTATVHGNELLEMGYSVDQVVHDYGDLCQAITELAFERDAPFEIGEFRTLNRCLDNAIADAVREFSLKREATLASKQSLEEGRRAGFLAHELRNALSAATLALRALEVSNMPVNGATGAVLKRGLASMATLIAQALREVQSGSGGERRVSSLASFIADAASAAQLEASAAGCSLHVSEVDPALGIEADRDLLLAALANLLQNAFKFTRPRTEVELRAYAQGERVLIEVADHCGGLPPGRAEKLFMPFYKRRGDNAAGLGLGLSIARQSVEAEGGTLSVRDVPGSGCVFTISLPRHRTVAGDPVVP